MEALPRRLMANFPVTRASLLLRLRDQQDDLAWAEFIELYVPLVYRFARKQGLPEADAATCRRTSSPRLQARSDGWNTIRARRLSQLVVHDCASQVGQLVCGPGESNAWERRHRRATTPRAIAGSRRHGRRMEHRWEQRQFAWACAQVRRDVTSVTWQAFWRTAVEGSAAKDVAQELGSMSPPCTSRAAGCWLGFASRCN